MCIKETKGEFCAAEAKQVDESQEKRDIRRLWIGKDEIATEQYYKYAQVIKVTEEAMGKSRQLI
jgi:hypothetical protein